MACWRSARRSSSAIVSAAQPLITDDSATAEKLLDLRFQLKVGADRERMGEGVSRADCQPPCCEEEHLRQTWRQGNMEARMSEGQASLTGPDLTQGVSVAKITDGAMLLGHAHGEAVLLARRGDEFFAVSAVCTHYSGPLAEGLVVDDTVRCPWHHACFDLRTGEALRAPALSPIASWSVEQRDGKIIVRDKRAKPQPKPARFPANFPRRS